MANCHVTKIDIDIVTSPEKSAHPDVQYADEICLPAYPLDNCTCLGGHAHLRCPYANVANHTHTWGYILDQALFELYSFPAGQYY